MINSNEEREQSFRFGLSGNFFKLLTRTAVGLGVYESFVRSFEIKAIELVSARRVNNVTRQILTRLETFVIFNAQFARFPIERTICSPFSY